MKEGDAGRHEQGAHPTRAPRRIAIVHDALVTFGGSERVLAELLAIYPDADLFATIDFLHDTDRRALGGRVARTTAAQRLPFARHLYRHYLPLMPLLIEQLDLRGYDLVISNAHSVAKGVLTGPDQLHVSYVHSPMRYAWDLQHEYLEASRWLARGPLGWMARAQLHRLRLWDAASAQRIDVLLGNSAFITRRIRKVYRRDAQVMYPPVDTDAFVPDPTAPRGHDYVTVSRMVPYKRIDLLVRAFAHLPDAHLTVIGDGPERARIHAVAPANVTFLGAAPFATVRERLQSARAFLFAAEEDFGIAPLEAQACGTPVLAYARGGALETVHDGVTGRFFHDRSPEAIAAAIRAFESERERFDPARIRAHAERFSRAAFRERFAAATDAAWAAFVRERGG
jgi:glycosyltransferase involved in cell wall biosynthesis